MHLNVGKEVAAFKRMTVNELKDRYSEVFGEETRANNKAWLVKRIAWRIQALAEGVLSERARQRAAELANDANLRLSPPRQAAIDPLPEERTKTETIDSRPDNRLPLAGTIIIREYKGEKLQVKVLPHGFEFEGEIYKSLSAVAKRITGSHCNGYLFFRLGAEGENR